MWDSLGVLALRAASGVARRRERRGGLPRGTRVPRATGFAFGGPILPLGGVAIGASSMPIPRILRRPGLPRRLRRAARATPRPPSPPVVEVTRLRVPLAEERPPLSRSVIRLVAWVTAGAVATSAVILLVGTVAVRTVLDLVG